MKKLLLIPIILVVLLLTCIFTGCSLIEPFIPDPDPVVELSANVVIVDWEQVVIDEKDYVKVYYKITNTGTVEIDYYQIWFKVICEGGGIYGELAEGTGIAVGDYDFNDFNINVDSGEAIRVEVVDWELTHWKF